jgi:Cu2+-exporting ATPase
VATLGADSLPLPNIVEEPGRGVRAVTTGGEIRLGSAEFCSVRRSGTESADDTSSIFFRMGDRVAEFRIGQRLRADAVSVISELKARGLGLLILSGDKRAPVESVARSLGIETWHSNCAPDQKIAALKALSETGCKVLMVGDGLNDAPALAAAHVSLAPVAAADLTQAQADGLLLGESLRPVLDAIDISCRAKTVMRQNLGLAVVYNIVAIPLAVFGFVTPLVAAAAMSGSSILVSANALRARSWSVSSREAMNRADQKAITT